MAPRPYCELASRLPGNARVASCPKRSIRFFALFCGPLLLFFLVACDRKPSAQPRAEPRTTAPEGDAVAVVGEAVITREAFQAELNRRGDVRSKESVLEEMIRFEALLARAKAAGYDHDPAVVAGVNRMIVARFQEDQLAKHVGPQSMVREEDVRDYYQKNADKFVRPERARAAVIFWRVPSKATPEKKSELRERAETVLTEARKTDATGFGLLVQKHSEDQATRYSGGDTGWLRRDEKSARWDAMLIDRIFALARPGDLSPVISTENGLSIARLKERTPTGVLPLDQVRDRIEYAVSQEERRQLEEQFFDRMKAGFRIEVNRRLLQSIQAPTPVVEKKPPSMPPG